MPAVAPGGGKADFFSSRGASRFLKFEGTYTHLGFNNQLQDALMTAQLAYLSNRAYTIQPYIWNRYSLTRVVVDNGHLRSAQIPLGAFIAGPAVGAEMVVNRTSTAEARSAHPRAVARKFFDEVCPSRSSKIRNVDIDKVRVKYGIEEAKEPSAAQILEAWSTELGAIEDSCVVVRGEGHVFSFGYVKCNHDPPDILDNHLLTARTATVSPTPGQRSKTRRSSPNTPGPRSSKASS